MIKIPPMDEIRGSVPALFQGQPGSKAVAEMLREMTQTHYLPEAMVSNLSVDEQADMMIAFCETQMVTTRVAADFDEAVAVLEFVDDQQCVRMFFEITCDQRTGAITHVTFSPLRTSVPLSRVL
jgi:hypothetical protein